MCPYYPLPIHLDKIITSYERAVLDDPAYRSALSDYWKTHDAKVEFRPEAGRLWMDGQSGFYLGRTAGKGSLIEGCLLANSTGRLLRTYPSVRTVRLLFQLRHLAPADFGIRLGPLRGSTPMMIGLFHVLTILDALDRHRAALPNNHVFLEIGAGSGLLSALWKMFYPSAQVIILDLPTVLRYSSYLISRCFPSARILFYADWKGKSQDYEGYDFVILPHFTVGEIADQSINLAVNVNSMQEMHIDTVTMYFTQMRRVLTTPNLFYCVNREKKLVVGEGPLTRFDDYPYLPSDQHWLDIPDKFSQGGPLLLSNLMAGRDPFLHREVSPVRIRLSSLPPIFMVGE